jgi:hypothetical protein
MNPATSPATSRPIAALEYAVRSEGVTRRTFLIEMD